MVREVSPLPLRRPPPPSEELGEDVVEAEPESEVAEDLREIRSPEDVLRPVPLVDALPPVRVVLLPLLVVRKDRVRLRELLELPLRLGRLVPVGMVLQGELSVGVLYLVKLRVARDFQNLVIVALGVAHQRSAPVTSSRHRRLPCSLRRRPSLQAGLPPAKTLLLSPAAGWLAAVVAAAVAAVDRFYCPSPEEPPSRPRSSTLSRRHPSPRASSSAPEPRRRSYPSPADRSSPRAVSWSAPPYRYSSRPRFAAPPPPSSSCPAQQTAPPPSSSSPSLPSRAWWRR